MEEGFGFVMYLGRGSCPVGTGAAGEEGTAVAKAKGNREAFRGF